MSEHCDTNLDELLSQAPNLKELYFSNNSSSLLYLNDYSALEKVTINSPISVLYIDSLTSLNYLKLENTLLNELNFSFNNLDSLIISNNDTLSSVYIDSENIYYSNISNNDKFNLLYLNESD